MIALLRTFSFFMVLEDSMKIISAFLLTRVIDLNTQMTQKSDEKSDNNLTARKKTKNSKLSLFCT
jgi:hypothetical protein